tara:strand:- start:8155 stop:9549 length:1395 start_codon:yes stop_codon:yes gene_type:complete
MSLKIKPKPIDPRISRPLMKHQEDILDYLNGRASIRRGGALYVEMRLGKTLSMIEFAKFKFKRILVIAPLVVCKTWELELKTDGEFEVSNIGGIPKQKKIKALQSTKAKWTIINYESARIVDIHQYFDNNTCIILDESIAIANPMSQVAKYFLNNKYWPQWSKYVLCGNPAPEGNHQYVTQGLFYNGKFLDAFDPWRFRSKYYDAYGHDWCPKPGVFKQMYDEVHEKSFVLTRTQAGIGSKKMYQSRYIKMTSKQRAAYNQMLTEFEVDNVETSYIPVQMLYLSRIAGGMKLIDPDKPNEPVEWYSLEKFNEVIKLLRGELKGQQVLLWFRFREELYKMESMLREVGITFCSIHGSVKNNKREELRLDFMKGKFQCSLMTVSTAKRGLDFSSADSEIYVSNDYSSDARTQSEDRIVHPKKTTPLLVMDILTEDSIDEQVKNLLDRKGITAKVFMSDLLKGLGLG